MSILQRCAPASAPALSWASATLALALAACGGSSSEAPSTLPQSIDLSRLKLERFSGADACGDYANYLTDSFTEQWLQGYACYDFAPCAFTDANASPETPEDGGPTAGSGSQPDRVSQTNTQEAGVDEEDIAKLTANGRLYVLTASKLVTLPAYPPSQLAEAPQTVVDLATQEPNFYADGFFLDENKARIVVLGSAYRENGPVGISLIVDIGDPAKPFVTQTLVADGYPLEARRVGSRVHRVLRDQIIVPTAFYSDSELLELRDDYWQAQQQQNDSAAAAIKQQVHDRIGSVYATAQSIDAYLPRYSDAAGQHTVACDAIARPSVSLGAGLAVLQSFDTTGGVSAVSAAINNSYLVYASSTHLYLAQDSGGWVWQEDQANESAIYRFALSTSGAPTYVGVGKVPGSLPGRFALSEYDGALRVATTERRWNDTGVETENHLSVLDTDSSEMQRIGGVDGLAPGETIQGVRFVGDRGYIVTFRQVDPLFAFDLSNPAQPVLASTLKIPGFSSYLQPLGDDYLLTIGRGGDDTQLNGQVAVQLFDVRNLHDVRQVAVIEPATPGDSYTYSAAEYDPHAFSYFSDTAGESYPGTLSIPLSDYSSATAFSGFLVLRIDPESAQPLSERGRIDHSSFYGQNDCASANGDAGCPYYGVEPRRSLFMQDGGVTTLLTLSTMGVLASDALQPQTEIGRAALPYEPTSYCCVIATDG